MSRNIYFKEDIKRFSLPVYKNFVLTTEIPTRTELMR